ncbi:MAG: tryptophan synthase subunit alpha [Propionibacteriaceae bacterium]|nr:tryptophan synthase subunit alpha [Propionibacteriaceae bacterium]
MVYNETVGSAGVTGTTASAGKGASPRPIENTTPPIDRIAQAFQSKAFIAFLTGGDPTLEDTRRYVKILAEAGASLVEIGIPFSDPIAEGPVIQEASARALSSATGTTPEMLFELVRALREEDGLTIPLALMTYLNPVHHYGYEEFFARAADVGVDALIVPDLPFEEHAEVLPAAQANGVALISMIAPTSSSRARKIAANAQGFIYLVSSLGVTGVRSEITTDIGSIVDEIRQVTDVPVAVGFGISTPAQAATMAAQADGVIVGSAIVRLIAENGSHADDALRTYVSEMVSALPQE